MPVNQATLFISQAHHMACHAYAGAIEETQVALEAFCDEVDFQKLEGLWRLIYTTALDVVRGSTLATCLHCHMAWLLGRLGQSLGSDCCCLEPLQPQ